MVVLLSKSMAASFLSVMLKNSLVKFWDHYFSQKRYWPKSTAWSVRHEIFLGQVYHYICLAFHPFLENVLACKDVFCWILSRIDCLMIYSCCKYADWVMHLKVDDLGSKTTYQLLPAKHWVQQHLFFEEVSQKLFWNQDVFFICIVSI